MITKSGVTALALVVAAIRLPSAWPRRSGGPRSVGGSVRGVAGAAGLAAALLAGEDGSVPPGEDRPPGAARGVPDVLAGCERLRFELRRRCAIWAAASGACALLGAYAMLWGLNIPSLALWLAGSAAAWRPSWSVLAATAGLDAAAVAVAAAVALRGPGSGLRAADALAASLAAPLARLAQAVEVCLNLGVGGLYRGQELREADGSSAPTPYPPAAADNARLAERIGRISGLPAALVRSRLYREQLWPGSTVKHEMRRRGAARYEWSDALLDLYRDSDAFLFELAVWNRNRYKLAMRRWLMRALGPAGAQPLRVLCYGDGLGFDSLCLASLGHDVTYFEVSSLCVAFARDLFGETGCRVRVAESDPLGERVYDAVICLDVLEHVPDPPALVRAFAGALAPGGRLISHAPFGILNPELGTHLRSNRRYYGDERLYADAGLRLVDGHWLWNPIVLRKAGPVATPEALPPRLVRATGALMRWGVLAALWDIAVEKLARPLHWLCLRLAGLSLFEGVGTRSFGGREGQS